jgi:hypothetical protein
VTGTFRGAWNTGTAYHVNDTVTYQGTQYVVTANHTSGGTFSTANLSSVANSTGGHLTASAVGFGLSVKEGTGAKMGVATLVAGTVTVANASVTATSRIFLTGNVDGGTPGWHRVSARVNGTSFTITSSSNTDTSTVAWLICEPA